MEQYVYVVYEYASTHKRLVYAFEEESSALGLVHFIENNDTWCHLVVEKELRHEVTT